MGQQNSSIYDANLVLQASATKTSTWNGTAVTLKPQKNQVLKAVIDVSAIDFTTTDETYVLTIAASADGTNYYEVGQCLCAVLGTLTTGRYEIAIMGDHIQKVVPSATSIRLTGTLGGTTPSITLRAFLTKV